MEGIYMVFLAMWDKLRERDAEDRAAGCDGPGLHFVVTSQGEPVASGFYDNAYKLTASCLGEVFEILNTAHPEDYKRRSLSVGDIVVDPDGDAWVVKGCGWEKLHGFNPFSTAARDHEGDLREAWKAHTAPIRARMAARRRAYDEIPF